MAESATDSRVREKIRQLLRDRSLSDGAFAAGVGRTRQWASMYLSGKRSMPMRRLHYAAAFFNLPVEYFLTDSNGQEPTQADTDKTDDLLGHRGRDRKGTSKVGAHAAPAYEARRLQSVVTIYESAFAHLRKRALEEVGYIDKIIGSLQMEPAPSAKPGRRRHDRRHADRAARRIVK